VMFLPNTDTDNSVTQAGDSSATGTSLSPTGSTGPTSSNSKPIVLRTVAITTSLIFGSLIIAVITFFIIRHRRTRKRSVSFLLLDDKCEAETMRRRVLTELSGETTIESHREKQSFIERRNRKLSILSFLSFSSSASSERELAGQPTPLPSASARQSGWLARSSTPFPSKFYPSLASAAMGAERTPLPPIQPPEPCCTVERSCAISRQCRRVERDGSRAGGHKLPEGEWKWMVANATSSLPFRPSSHYTREEGRVSESDTRDAGEGIAPPPYRRVLLEMSMQLK
jgi:hypothetical protein